MPISSKKLVYDFRRKYNAILSGKNKNIALVDVIAYLNESQEIWFENRVMVAQTNQRVRNDLRIWKVDKKSIGCTGDEECCNADYPEDLYFRLNQQAIVCHPCCPGVEKRIPLRMLQSDDLSESMLDPFRKSDFYYEQLNATESSDGLIVYHDGEMEVKDVIIDYYRKPKEIHAPSLEDCDGEYYYDYCGAIVTKDQDFENDNTFSANIVVDIAVLIASRDSNDVQGFQTMLSKILQTQNIAKL